MHDEEESIVPTKAQKEATVTRTFRLPESLDGRLKEIAAAKGQSVSAVALLLMQAAVKEYDRREAARAAKANEGASQPS